MNNNTQLHIDSKMTGQLQDRPQRRPSGKTAKRKKTNRGYHVRRTHKDSLFRLVFDNRKDLLELYNAVNGTYYTNTKNLSVYTLEDAIYISYKNDISFLFGEMLNLYEHQSTLNPNMPVRGFIYIAKNIEAYIELAHLDIYSSVLQKLPLPQYVVFYNGAKDAPEKMIMKLSDAFPVIEGREPCIECKATLLNINYGHNQKLMDRCRKLGEYAYFIHSIREKQNQGMSLDQAVNDAIEDCIREHILESILVKQRAEVKNVVLSTFNQENHDRILKEAHEKIGEERGIAIGQKKGIAIGRKKGIAIGQDMVLKDIVSKKLAKNKSIKQICDDLEQDEKTILSIIEKIKQ